MAEYKVRGWNKANKLIALRVTSSPADLDRAVRRFSEDPNIDRVEAFVRVYKPQKAWVPLEK